MFNIEIKEIWNWYIDFIIQNVIFFNRNNKNIRRATLTYRELWKFINNQVYLSRYLG